MPAYRKRTVVSTEFVTVCGMTFVSEFFPASNIGRPSLPRVETRAFRATWRCSQDAGKMRTLVDCLRLMRDRSIVHERICREDDRKTEKSVCERHRRPKEIGRPPVPSTAIQAVLMPCACGQQALGVRNRCRGRKWCSKNMMPHNLTAVRVERASRASPIFCNSTLVE